MDMEAQPYYNYSLMVLKIQQDRVWADILLPFFGLPKQINEVLSLQKSRSSRDNPLLTSEEWNESLPSELGAEKIKTK